MTKMPTSHLLCNSVADLQPGHSVYVDPSAILVEEFTLNVYVCLSAAITTTNQAGLIPLTCHSSGLSINLYNVYHRWRPSPISDDAKLSLRPINEIVNESSEYQGGPAWER